MALDPTKWQWLIDLLKPKPDKPDKPIPPDMQQDDPVSPPTKPARAINLQHGTSDSYPGELWIAIPQQYRCGLVRVDGYTAVSRRVEGKLYHYVPNAKVTDGKLTIDCPTVTYTATITKPDAQQPSPSPGTVRRVYADEYRGLTNGNRSTWFVPVDLHVGQTVTFKAGPVRKTVRLYNRKGVPGWEGDRNICKESDSRPGHAAVLINARYRGSYSARDCWIEI